MGQPDYMKYVTFRPGPDFREQMERHRDDRAGDVVMRVGTDYQCPDYDVLGDIPLSNYVSWRSRLTSPDPPRGCRGFWFLRMSEMANLDIDRSQVRRECLILSREHRGNQPTDPFRFLVDYQLTHGRDFDFPWIFPKGDPCNIALVETLSYPPGPFTRQLVARLMEDHIGDGRDADRVTPRVNTVLTAIGDYLESKGTDILTEFGRGRILRQHTVFGDIPYFGECNHMLEFTDIDPNGRMGDFLEGVVKVAYNRYCEGCGRGQVKVPSIITKGMRAAIADAFDGPSGGDRGPKRHDAVIMTMSEYMSSEGVRPVMVTYPDASREPPDMRLPERIREFREMDDRVCGFIPSGHRTPDYGKLRDGRLDYYMFWRNGVRDGRFATTDRGYMWLFLCELVNDGDPRRALDTVLRLHREYGDDDRESLIGGVAIFIANVHDLDIPDTSVREGMDSVGRVIHQMCDGGEGRIDRNGFELLSTIDGKGRIPDFDDVCTEIMNRSLREVNRMVEARNRVTGGLCGYYRLGPFNETLSPPFGIPTREGRFSARVYNAFDSYFVSDIRDMMRFTVSARKAASGKGRTRPNTKALGGVQYASVVAQIARKVVSELPPEGPKSTKKATFSLDMSAVDVAERDLRSVTEMMSTDVEGDTVIDEGHVTESVSVGPDPGTSFASSLTDGERTYLWDCLDGHTRVDVRLEDSINAKAMDHLGDTLVEGGRVFDEYAGDLLKALGKR